MEDLKFNSVASQFLVPFDESEISERRGSGDKIFSYVDPYRYRRRLLSIAENGFTLEMKNIVHGKDGVSGDLRLTVEKDMVRYDVTVSGYEEYEKAAPFIWNPETQKKDIPNPKAGQVLDRGNDVKKLKASLLKSALTEMGVGLHLYDAEVHRVRPASTNGASSGTQSAPASSANASADGWDGSATMSFGKFKGVAYRDVDFDYLTWAAAKERPDTGSIRELKRRSGTAETTASTQAQGSLITDEDVPF